jgi:prepilin-type N-terminal cleavage/methylation domain-containing protein
MRRRQGIQQRRPGFTLIELLVVIAIIAILVSLTAAAVMKVRLEAEKVKNRNDISQLSASIAAFCSKYNVDMVPSFIVLREDGRYGDNPNPQIAALELASEAYLKRLWPRMITSPRTGNPSPNSRVDLSVAFNGQFTDWNNSGSEDAGQSFILQGDQCLVFFLGGMISNGGCIGFSTNVSNPTVTSGTMNPPVFEFPSNRLVDPVVAFPNLPNNLKYVSHFPTFLDPYGSPYAYFNSRGGAGGAANAYSNDCPSLSVVPYQRFPATNTIGNFYNQQGFQIISAGYGSALLTNGPGSPSFAFDPNGVWVSATGAPLNNANTAGFYTMTNFSQYVLGAGNP